MEASPTLVVVEAEDATDELLALLLDDLGPALQWYRDEVARRVGLSPGEFLCLELCRRHGSITSGRVAERLGLTRSAVWKLLRRLEAAGHVVRAAGRDHEHEVEIRLRPHADRDAVLDDLRRVLRREVRDLVIAYGLHGERHATLATALVGLANRVFGHARALGDAAAEARLLAARRRAHEADTSTPWWQR